MDAQQELESKRREVREEILAMKDRIPSARILNQFGKAFPHNSLGYWLMIVTLLNIILIGPGFFLALILRETENFWTVSFGGLIATECVLVGFFAAHIAVKATLDDLANQIIAKMNNSADISKIVLWLDGSFSMSNIASFAVPFGLIWAVLGVGANSTLIHQFTGLGFALWCLEVGLLAGPVFYVPLWATLLAFHLKDYQYETNAYSPADSEVILNISEMLTRSIYILAIVEAVVSLVVASKLIEEETRVLFSAPILLFGWLIIIVQFLTMRNTLKTITNRAKWTTLNRIRTKINALEANGDLSDKDTAERLMRLAEIHKQIMASKTSTFDLKSATTLFSQLMLPLFGLLLGNFDKILKLLQR